MNENNVTRRAIVCGGSKGIGAAIAAELMRQGMEVTIISRSTPTLAGAEWLSCDLSERASVDALAERIAADSRGYDILVNNSGGPKPGPAQNVNYEDFDSSVNAHLYANMKLSTAVLGAMTENGWGRIINVISVSAKSPVPNLAVSNALRGAVVNWAKTLSSELAAAGVTVNNVLPGYTATERLTELFGDAAAKAGTDPEAVQKQTVAQIPAARFGKPEEIAAVAAFFASDAASYVTGQSLCVDGGWSSWS